MAADKAAKAAYQREWRKTHPGYASKYVRKWKANNPEKVKASQKVFRETHKDYYADWGLKSRIGISLNEKKNKLIEQGGVCPICTVRPPKHADHCHITKRFRGILCRQCNMALGLFQDNLGWMENAMKYVKHFQEGK